MDDDLALIPVILVLTVLAVGIIGWALMQILPFVLLAAGIWFVSWLLWTFARPPYLDYLERRQRVRLNAMAIEHTRAEVDDAYRQTKAAMDKAVGDWRKFTGEQ